MILTVNFLGLGVSLDNSAKVYENPWLGFGIVYVGEAVECGEASVCFILPIEDAWVRVLVDTKPAVFLPGTFGGWYLFEDREQAPLGDHGRGPALTQKFVLENITFTKSYWAIYGGAGGWDTVLAADTRHNGLYYSLALQHKFIEGVPGDAIQAKDMVKAAVGRMTASESPIIEAFNAMLSTFYFVEKVGQHEEP